MTELLQPYLVTSMRYEFDGGCDTVNIHQVLVVVFCEDIPTFSLILFIIWPIYTLIVFINSFVLSMIRTAYYVEFHGLMVLIMLLFVFHNYPTFKTIYRPISCFFPSWYMSFYTVYRLDRYISLNTRYWMIFGPQNITQ